MKGGIILKNQYQNTKAIATYTMNNFGGIEILAVDAYEERVYYAINDGGQRQKVRFGKMHMLSNGASFDSFYGRINLADCIRTNI